MSPAEPEWRLPVQNYGAFRGAEVLNFPPPSWILEGYIEEAGLTVLYGDPGNGKSVVAMDWACTLASGASKWLHCDVRLHKPKVLYILGEGATGLRQRIGAWMLQRGLDPMNPDDWPDVEWLRGPMNLYKDPEGEHTEDQLFLRDKVKAEGYDIIFVDTLSRTFGSGQENDSRDMKAYLETLELYQEVGAAVVVIHHATKSTGSLRGSGTLGGGVENIFTMEAVIEDGLMKSAKLGISKAKDGGGSSRPIQFVAIDHKVPVDYGSNGGYLYRQSPVLVAGNPKTSDEELFNRVWEALLTGQHTRTTLQEITGDNNKISAIVNKLLEEEKIVGNKGEKLRVVTGDAVERL